MVRFICDFCSKEVELNADGLKNFQLDNDINYYVVCNECNEKVDNLVNNNYGIISIVAPSNE